MNPGPHSPSDRSGTIDDQFFIDDYKQRDFQGLLAFFRKAVLQDLKGPIVGEKSGSRTSAASDAWPSTPPAIGWPAPG